MARKKTFELFAVTPPGLNEVAAGELRRLGLLLEEARPPLGPSGGGVTFRGGLEAVYTANLWLRTATRVLLRLDKFYAAHFSELRRKAAELPWELVLAPGQPVAMRVTSHKSRLYHTGAVAQRLRQAIGDHLGQEPPEASAGEGASDEEGDELPPAQMIVVRLVRNRATISADTSGEALQRRGYRQALAKAPLRETLAAGMLLAAGWDGRAPLLDPFCGSGTIPVEGAMMAQGLAPGRARPFAFMEWPNFDAELWQRVLAQPGLEPAGAPSGDRPQIQGSDRDAGAVQMAQDNAERAGVLGAIEFSQRAISAIEPPPGPGWVVTNPPYGVRVSANKDLRNLYAQLGNVLREKCPGWRVAVLCSDERLLGQTGLPFEERIAMNNGGVAVKLAIGRVPER